MIEITIIYMLYFYTTHTFPPLKTVPSVNQTENFLIEISENYYRSNEYMILPSV